MKSTKLVKSIALVLVLMFAFATFAACKNGKGDDNKQGGDRPSYTTPLVVAYDQFTQKFSPFFSETGYDQDVAGLTQIGCMTTTRTGSIVYNAIEGEKETYNGTEYEYKGIANIAVNKGTDQTVYSIKIRDDLKFSDGKPVTIDDVLFYYYVVLDPNYTGASTVSSIDIVGLKAYQYNNSNIESFDGEDYVANISQHQDLQQAVIDSIIRPTITSELDWVKNDVMPSENYAAYTKYATSPQQVLYALYDLSGENVEYVTEDVLDSAGQPVMVSDTADPTQLVPKTATYIKYSDTLTAMTEQQVIDLLVAQYGFGEGALTMPYDTNYDGVAETLGNYAALGVNYAGDHKYYDADVLELAMQIGAQTVTGTEVPNIAGIKKVDNYTVEVTTNGYMANAIYQICSATVTPKHYYGDESMWDFENNKFGFANRTAEGMKSIEAKNTAPMGAGPYKFVKYEDKVVYFEANPNYWEGEPYIKYIQFKETKEEDKVAAIDTADVDIANEVAGSKARLAEIASKNSNGDITGDAITSSAVWNLGYGYIGLNAARMNVAGQSGSTESKNLRKAFATILSVCRDTAIESYYGDSAAVIQYPISSTSWAAPQVSDTGYKQAFSVDVNGADIFTSAMTVDQKKQAAVTAAIGFLKAAGYTFDEATQKFTAAPAGAKMAYEIWIPANGGTDHPAVQIVTDAQPLFEQIGIELIFKNLATASLLWNGLPANQVDMWAAAWGSTIDPDMYQVYHSSNVPGKPGATGSNHYRIESDVLDNLIMEGRKSDDQSYRKTIYKSALDEVMDWAVELPTYQRKNLVCFSTERINLDTLTKDITTYWGWTAEIHTLELNSK